MQLKQVYTTFEAAKLCHVSPLSIINWVNAGRLSAFRTPGGHRRIRRQDLVAFMRENALPIPDELLGESGGQRRVLIVDDDAGVRELLTRSLEAASFEVLTAGDGYEAGRLVATRRPEIVLLDLKMPGVDGFQVCRSIKQDPQTASTIVAAMTGYYSTETEARILECGAVRCFAKPFKPGEILEFVESMFVSVPAPRRGPPAQGRG